MKKLFLITLVTLASMLGLTSTRADNNLNNSDQYVNAFMFIREAERAEANSDWATAKAKYESALKVLNSLRTTAADWHPNMVDFRIKGCTAKLAEVEPKVPAPVPVPAPVVVEKPVTPAPVTPAPVTPEAGSPDVTAKLRADLAKLDEENKALKTKLAAKPAPTPKQSPEINRLRTQLDKTQSELDQAQSTCKREIANLEKENQRLKADLANNNRKIADLNNQIDDLKKRPAPKIKPEPTPVAVKPDETPLVKPVKPAPKPTPPAEPTGTAPTQNFGPRPVAPVETPEAPVIKKPTPAPKPVVEKPAPAPKPVVVAKPAPPAPAPVKPAPAPVVKAPVTKPAPETVHAAPTQNFGPRPVAPVETPEAPVVKKPVEKPAPAPKPIVEKPAPAPKPVVVVKPTPPAPAPVKPAPAPVVKAPVTKPAPEPVHSAPTQNFGPRPVAPVETPEAPVVKKPVEKPAPAPKPVVEKPAPAPKPVVVVKPTPPAPAPVKPAPAPVVKAPVTKPAPEPVHSAPTQNFGPRPITDEEKTSLPSTTKTSEVTAPQKIKTAPELTTGSVTSQELCSESEAARAQAERLKKAQARVAELERENKDLTAQLATTRTNFTAKHASTESQVAELQKQNASLKADLVEAKKLATTKESAEIKRLQAEVRDGQEANRKSTALAEANKRLNSQLTDAQKQVVDLQQQLAAKTAASATESSEVTKLQDKLDATLAIVERLKSTSARVTVLEKENAELRASLAAAPKPAFVQPLTAGQSEEVAKLRAELNGMRGQAESTQPLQERIATLTKENAVLKEQLKSARQTTAVVTTVTDSKAVKTTPATPALTDKNAALLKRLREENSYLRHLLEEYAEKVPEMKPRLRKYTQENQP